MKKIFTAIAVIAITAMTFSSCENDAPNINFSHTETHISDFSGIIKALQDQTTSLEEKLALLRAALEAQTLTLEQKLEILTLSIENQTSDLKGAINLLSDVVDQGLISLEAATKLVTEAILAQTTSLETMISSLESAITAGFIDMEAATKLVKDAILAQTTSLETMIPSLESAITAGFIDMKTATEMVEDAIRDIVQSISTGGELYLLISDLNWTMSEGFLSMPGTIETIINTAISRIMGYGPETLPDIIRALQDAINGTGGMNDSLVEVLNEILARL